MNELIEVQHHNVHKHLNEIDAVQNKKKKNHWWKRKKTNIEPEYTMIIMTENQRGRIRDECQTCSMFNIQWFMIAHYSIESIDRNEMRK